MEAEIRNEKTAYKKMECKKLSRRDFFKLGGTTLLGTAATLMTQEVFAHKAHELGLIPRLAMVIDLRRCIGCHSCSVACKAEYEIPSGVFRAWVKQLEKGKYPNVRKYSLPRLCNHCCKPICATVCPVKATRVREDGIVWIDQNKCIGCKTCIAACPYGVRFVHPKKKVVDKCDFCMKRVDRGQEPACVVTCMAQARHFGDINDPESEVARLVATNPVYVLKPDKDTQPQVYYISSDMHFTEEGGI